MWIMLSEDDIHHHAELSDLLKGIVTSDTASVTASVSN